MSKLRITTKSRAIMQELVDLHEEFQDHTRILASSDTDERTAREVGADRESVRAQILGAAWRLVKEITGRTV